jgi:hypothetical protein
LFALTSSGLYGGLMHIYSYTALSHQDSDPGAINVFFPSMLQHSFFSDSLA